MDKMRWRGLLLLMMLIGSSLGDHGPVNIPISQIIDSPPYHSGGAPDNLIDGNPHTIWNTNVPSQHNYNNWYIIFELEKSYAVSSVHLKNNGDYTHDITSFKLEASNDQVTWNMAGSVTDVVAGSNEWQSFEGFTATGKYLKFTVTQTESGWQPWLREIYFNGKLTCKTKYKCRQKGKRNRVEAVCQAKSANCDGTIYSGKGFCGRHNKCNCCVPSTDCKTKNKCRQEGNKNGVMAVCQAKSANCEGTTFSGVGFCGSPNKCNCCVPSKVVDE